MSNKLSFTKRSLLIPFFLLTYGITWGIGAFVILFPRVFQDFFGEISSYNPIAFAAVAAPTIAAVILTWVYEGWNGLRALLARLTAWRAGVQWYALILIGIPLGGWLVVVFVHPEPVYDLSTPALVWGALIHLFLFGPLIEEPGWRGFALPRLLNRFTPFVSSLILGVMWGVWHLPSFFISSLVQADLSLPLFLVMGIATSVLMTWIFSHTGGSVLFAILFHYAVNFNLSIIGVPLAAMTSFILIAATLVLVFDKEAGWFSNEKSQTPAKYMRTQGSNGAL
jgi:hypothetical protein